jgi:hypothetical protein
MVPDTASQRKTLAGKMDSTFPQVLEMPKMAMADAKRVAAT